MEITHFGSGICSYRRRITGAILFETRPAMIIRSLCRGEPRITSAPNREISKRDAIIDIISIAQQARPKLIGQMAFLRAQLISLSRLVIRSVSPKPSSGSGSSSARANSSGGWLRRKVVSSTALLSHDPRLLLERPGHTTLEHGPRLRHRARVHR